MHKLCLLFAALLWCGIQGAEASRTLQAAPDLPTVESVACQGVAGTFELRGVFCQSERNIIFASFDAPDERVTIDQNGYTRTITASGCNVGETGRLAFNEGTEGSGSTTTLSNRNVDADPASCNVSYVTSANILETKIAAFSDGAVNDVTLDCQAFQVGAADARPFRVINIETDVFTLADGTCFFSYAEELPEENGENGDNGESGGT